MLNLINSVIEQRERTLRTRLEVFSNIISSTISDERLPANENKKLVNKLIRIASENGVHHRKSADLISKNAVTKIRSQFGDLGTYPTLKVPQKDRKLFRHEHVVPCMVLSRYLVENKIQSSSEVFDVLLRHGMRAIILAEEDKLLSKQKMPDGWSVGDNPFARYPNSISLQIKPPELFP